MKRRFSRSEWRSVLNAPVFLAAIGLLILLIDPSPTLASGPEDSADPGQEETAKPAAARPSIPKEIAYESSVGDVLFPHRLHMKMGCGECHHQIHAEPLDTPHEDYLDSTWINCQTCHNASSETRSKYYECSACHHSETDDIADETLSAKVVVHKSCWKCHQTGTGAEASAGCRDCHVKPQQGAGLPVPAATP